MIAFRTLMTVVLVPLSLVSCQGADEPEGDRAAATREGSAAGSDTPRPGAGEPWVDGTELWLAPLELDEAGGGLPRLGEGRNITERAGYDNQPEFAPDGTIFYTLGVGDRTDIWRYDPATDTHTPVTATPDQSEYSATPVPGWEEGAPAVSIIRVEPDSAQRLWSIRLGATGAMVGEEVLLPDIRPVGYHAWANDTVLALFVLGEPATLQRAGPGPGAGEVVARDIGRGIERIPGEEAVSYTLNRNGGSLLRRYDPGEDTDRTIPLGIPLLPGPDHAWTPEGVLLYGADHRLYAVRPGGGQGPREVGALPDPDLTISRLAVSLDGLWVVLVVEREGR
jgi:hypothetical protein